MATDSAHRTDRTQRLHLVLMLALTFSTGVVDAVGYLGLDRVFTGNMTGNVVLLGMGLAEAAGPGIGLELPGAGELPVVRPALALAFFMAGALLAGRLLKPAPDGWSNRTSIALFSVAVIMAALAVLVAVVDVHASYLLGSAVTSLLGLVMGVQAATARRLKVAEITTVVVTSTITGLAAESRLAGGTSPFWVRRLLAIVLIGLGALVGALALFLGVWAGITLSAVITLTVALWGHLRHRTEARVPAAEPETSAAR